MLTCAPWIDHSIRGICAGLAWLLRSVEPANSRSIPISGFAGLCDTRLTCTANNVCYKGRILWSLCHPHLSFTFLRLDEMAINIEKLQAQVYTWIMQEVRAKCHWKSDPCTHETQGADGVVCSILRVGLTTSGSTAVADGRYQVVAMVGFVRHLWSVRRHLASDPHLTSQLYYYLTTLDQEVSSTFSRLLSTRDERLINVRDGSGRKHLAPKVEDGKDPLSVDAVHGSIQNFLRSAK